MTLAWIVAAILGAPEAEPELQRPSPPAAPLPEPAPPPKTPPPAEPAPPAETPAGLEPAPAPVPEPPPPLDPVVASPEDAAPPSVAPQPTTPPEPTKPPDVPLGLFVAGGAAFGLGGFFLAQSGIWFRRARTTNVSWELPAVLGMATGIVGVGAGATMSLIGALQYRRHTRFLEQHRLSAPPGHAGIPLFAVGGASMAVGVGFFARSAFVQTETNLGPYRANLGVGAGAFVVGAGLIAGGAVMRVRHQNSLRDNQLALTPTLLPGGGALMMSGRF